MENRRGYNGLLLDRNKLMMGIYFKQLLQLTFFFLQT